MPDTPFPANGLADLIDRVRGSAHQRRDQAYLDCLAALEQARQASDDGAFIALALQYAQLIDQQGFPDSGIDVLYEGLQLAQQRQQYAEQAALLHVIGRAYYTRAEYRNALQAWVLARDCASLADDVISWTHIEAGIAQIYDGLGDYRTACTLHQAAVRQAASLADPVLQLNTQLNLAYSLYRLGELGEAEKACLAALAHARALAHKDDEGEILFRLAQIRIAEGDKASAAPLLEQAATLCTETSHWWGLASTRLEQAGLLEQEGSTSAALGMADAACALAQRAGARQIKLDALRSYSRLAEKAGNLQDALQAEREAASLALALREVAGSQRELRMLEDLAGINPTPERQLLQLAADPLLHSGMLDEMSNLISLRGKQILVASSCSLWLLNAGTLECEARAPAEPDSSRSWDMQHYSDFHAALAKGKPVIAHTAAHHQQLGRLYTEQLAPRGVRSLLAIPLRLGETCSGALCFEHHEKQHNWQLEEVQYANQLAIITTRALGNLEQRRLRLVLAAQAQALQEAKEKAEQANSAKTLFISNISHELRTPMHAILSFARLGADKIDRAGRERLLHYFHNIIESGERMLEQVNDLLDLTKIESGKMSYQIVSHDLVVLCQVVCEEVRGIAGTRGIEILLENRSANGELECDGTRIEQVIRNLLSNAIKFSLRDATIRIVISDTPGELLLEVEDAGPGIQEADLPYIFDQFYQSDHHHQSGTGLGLSISREIALAHHGRLTARNLAQGGACFTLALPRTQPRAADQSASAAR